MVSRRTPAFFAKSSCVKSYLALNSLSRVFIFVHYPRTSNHAPNKSSAKIIMTNKINSFLFSPNTTFQFFFCSGMYHKPQYFLLANAFFQCPDISFFSGFIPNISVPKVDAKLADIMMKSASVTAIIQKPMGCGFPLINGTANATKQ